MTLQSIKNWKIKTILNDGDSILDVLLKDRNISDIENFLNPKLENIPSWKKLHNAKEAAKKILDAIKEDKKIFIHGDFDVDGISATALLWKFLFIDLANFFEKKIDVIPYIPDRVDEGYGLSVASLDNMIAQGAQLIITVDCGIRDRKLIEEYSEKHPVEFIITDHHQPPTDIIESKYLIVHQMFPGKEFPELKICGAAIAWLLIQSISELAKMEYPSNEGLDLVAMATVSDMMPLVGINRTFVHYGINEIKKGNRLGLKKLIQIAGVELKDIDSYHLGFILGPRINAAGRIGSPMDALRLLVSSNVDQVTELGAKLSNLNTLRQENTQIILSQVLTISDEFVNDNIVIAIGNGWHEGVIGLVAGKLFERLHKPVLVISKTVSGEVRGSARSFVNFNITKALEVHSECLEKYGGHAQAAGFTVKQDQLDIFKEKLLKFANENITPDLLERDLDIDLELQIKDVTIENFNEIERLKPFGYENSRPLVALKEVKVIDRFPMKGNMHMKLKVEKDGKVVTVIMFNCDEDIEKIPLESLIDVCGTMSLNEWNGKKEIQVGVKEWRLCS